MNALIQVAFSFHDPGPDLGLGFGPYRTINPFDFPV